MSGGVISGRVTVSLTLDAVYLLLSALTLLADSVEMSAEGTRNVEETRRALRDAAIPARL
jgi:hypothetical protein